MEKRRSPRQYMLLDLGFFALLLLVFESLIILASTRWFSAQPWTVSLVPALVAIVLVRWGPWAAIHAVLGGAVLCARSGAALPQYVIYCVGNCFPLLLLPWLSRWRREEGAFRTATGALGFGLAVLGLIQAGRAVMTLLFGATLPQAAGCFTTEAVTDLFTLLILWIVRRLDGLLEDQEHYLKRIQEEEKANRL